MVSDQQKNIISQSKTQQKIHTNIKETFIEKSSSIQMVKSQLQLAVLRFSRQCWKYINKLQEPAKTQMTNYVRTQFEKYKTLPRMKFHQIEYRLRSGKNKLLMIQQCGKIDNISLR